jgi:ATP-binding cassette subfamily B (MDR/TAP) protein 1
MDAGDVIESGTHDELMKKEGAYFALVQAQQLHSSSESQEMDEPKSDLMTKADNQSEVIVPKETGKDPKKANTSGSINLVQDSTLDKNISFIRIFALNRPEWIFLVLGAIGALLNGAVFRDPSSLMVTHL